MAACLKHHSTALWREAIVVFRQVIIGTVIKVLRRYGEVDPAGAEDIIQEVYLRLCNQDYRVLRECRIAEPLSLFGLVQAVATTTVLDHYRTSVAKKRGGGRTLLQIDSPSAECPDPGAHGSAERLILIREIDQHLNHIVSRISNTTERARDRQMFWLYYRQGLTSKEIAALPAMGLTQKGVESVIRRLTVELREVMGESAADPKGERP